MSNDLLNISLNQGKIFKKKKSKEGFSNNVTNNQQNNTNNTSELEEQYNLLTQDTTQNNNKSTNIQNQINECGETLLMQLKNMASEQKGNQESIKTNTTKFNKDYNLYDRIMNKMENKNLEYNNIEGMQTLKHSDIDGVVNNSQLYVGQENYSYILWAMLAVGVAAITIKQLSK
jgi:hypothetical protein